MGQSVSFFAGISALITVLVVLTPIVLPGQAKVAWAMDQKPLDNNISLCTLRVTNIGTVSIKQIFLEGPTPGKKGNIRVVGADFRTNPSQTAERMNLTIGFVNTGDYVDIYWQASSCPTKLEYRPKINP